MRALPLSIGPLHFVGIGGIGMSGIAEVLHNLGYRVQGSDLADGANVRRLIDLGIPVAVGHDAANLGAAEVIVTSSAVHADNPEIVAARARRLPKLAVGLHLVLVDGKPAGMITRQDVLTYLAGPA